MSARADIWMPLYVGDYLRDTSRLTTAQHGAYMLLIMDYWVSGPPPDDDQILASITRMPSDAWSIARALLEPFFELSDGQWRHKRIDAEREKAADNKKARSSKAKAAAEARWGKPADAPSNAPSIAQGNAPDMLEQCPSPSSSEYGDDGGTRARENSIALSAEAARAGGVRHIDPGAIARHVKLIDEWTQAGATSAEVLDTIRAVQAEAAEPISSLKYFDAAIRRAVALRVNGPVRASAKSRTRSSSPWTPAQ